MVTRHLKWVLLVLAIVPVLGSRTEAQEIDNADGLMAKFSALFPIDHSQPMSVPELCHRIDCLAEEMRTMD